MRLVVFCDLVDQGANRRDNGKKEEGTMERKHTKRAAVTDEEVEAEIAELKQDEYVKLAQRYDQYRARRRTYLYQLRIKQRKGIELAARGVTLENLEEMGDEP